MISKDTIKKIQDVAEIVDVVGDFVSLKRKGANYWACCPFHSEKTPSFSVAPAKNIFYCFGCHKTGNAVTFVMEIEKCSYPDALKYLAKKYHIEIEETQATPEQAAQANERESLLIVLEFAKKYYQQLLTQTDEGQSIGLSYFKERGFNQATIDKFELGYSQDAWNNLENEALRKGFSKDVLLKTGLVIQKEDGKSYDRFRGRVMFPIHNLAGRVVGFGARTLKKDDKPKYLNSPETAVYVKNEILYGLFQAKTAIREQDLCLLVEGYADVISLYQNGVQNVVASSGTALTENQIRLIRRFTENVVVLYDGDTAGIKAALRGIDLLLAQGLNVKAVTLPNEEDPDSLVRKIGGEAFKEYLAKNAKDFITFKVELLLAEAQNDPLKKATVIRSIVESISKIPDAIKRSVFYKQCSELLSIGEDVLVTEGNKIVLNEQKKIDKQQTELAAQQSKVDTIANELIEQQLVRQQKSTIDEIIAYQEKESIRLLVKYGQFYVEHDLQLWRYLFDELEEIQFHTAAYKEILDIYRKAVAENIGVDEEFLMVHGSPEVQKIVSALLFERYELSENWHLKHQIFIPKEKDVLPHVVYTNILRLKHRILEKLIAENIKKLTLLLTEEEQNECLQTHIALTNVKNDIAKTLGSVITGWH